MHAALAIEITPDRAASAARSELYALFCRVFRPPQQTPQAAEAIASIATALRALPYELAAASLPDLPSHETLERRYSSLFEAAGPRGGLSLHESDFTATPRSRIWEDLIRFYEHFGLRYDGSAIRLWPDHLLIELECLHYLSFLEAGCAGDVAPLQRAQRDFIGRHLLEWLPRLAERLARQSEAQPYLALLTLLEHFLAADRAWLERTLTHART